MPDFVLCDNKMFVGVYGEVKRAIVLLEDLALSTEQNDQIGRYLARPTCGVLVYCARNPAVPKTSPSWRLSEDQSQIVVPPRDGLAPQFEPHSEPVRIAPRPSSPALCQSNAKGYLLPDFYSGCATGIPGRFSEGLLLRRVHWNVDRADKGQGYDRTHARDGHQPLTDFIVAREQENLAMQLGKLFPQDPARGEQRLHNIG